MERAGSTVNNGLSGVRCVGVQKGVKLILQELVTFNANALKSARGLGILDAMSESSPFKRRMHT